MTERVPASFQQLRNDHTAENDRLTIFGHIATGGTRASSELAVTAQGSPNMSVNASAGGAYIVNDGGSNRGIYSVHNDGTVVINITTAHATLARRDLIVATVRDAQYAGGSSDWLLQVVTGTPNASPVDPTVPSNSITLARIAVAASASSITNGNITDLRATAQFEKVAFQERITIIPLAATDGVRVNRFSDITQYQHRLDANGDSFFGVEKGTMTIGPAATADTVVGGFISAYNRAREDTQRATVSTASTSYVSGTTDCAQTFVAPPSGRITAFFYMQATPGTSGEEVRCAPQIRNTNNAGSVVYAVTDADSVMIQGTTKRNAHGFAVIGGLTPGNTYYCQLMHRTVSGNSSNFQERRILVLPSA